MVNEFQSLLGRNGLLPHGYCFQWQPGLLWSTVGADTLIALAYFSIPLAIFSFARRRPKSELGLVPYLFSAFITACGLTHVLDVWTVWRPDYEIHAAVKVMTAAISVFTAVVLWRLMPRALAIPSVAELRSALSALRDEVDRRRSAEDLLGDLERALATALAASGAAFVATDARGRITRMNAVAEAVTGWPQADALGLPLWEVLRREGQPDAPASGNAVDRLRATADADRQPRAAICVARDGTRTPIELSAEIAQLPDGSVRGMNVVFRDMTRLSRAEADLRRLAAVVASSADAIITKDMNGTITSWNEAAERLFGWRADEIVGQPVQLLIPPERETEEMRILADLAGGVVRPPFDTVRRARDGHRIEVSVSITPVRDALGRVVGGAKVARDLTHQRRIETALRQNEQRLRFALDAAAIGDWELSVATGTLHGSLRFARCFGHEALPEPWRLPDLLAAVHPLDRDAVSQGLQRALAQHGEWHHEFRVSWPDGSEHWLRMDGKVREDDGLSPRMTGIAGDVTTVRNAEQARQAVERLGEENRRILEASRMKSQFLANMSHELRTPLNAVIGFADLLRAGAVPPDSPRHAEYLGHVASSGRHLLQIINDVLDLSKVEAGKLVFTPGQVDPQSLVDEVVAALGALAAGKRLELTARLAPGLHDLQLDASRLRQVMFNFLSNAIKFTPERGRVELRLLPEGPYHFRIEVEDNGIGIAPEDQERLFVEFQQLDAGYDKRHQGTGLGLALTRQLVQAQGGRVGVYSQPGAGSRFYAVLPRRPDTGPAASPRVLVSQDLHVARDQLARGLAEAGIAADAAGSLAEVLRLVRTTRYDAVTLDLVMRDGLALRALGELRAQGGAPVGSVRAISMRAGPDATAAFPIANLLTKPLQAEELQRVLAPLRERWPAGRPVLVVDDDPLACEMMLGALAAVGLESVALQDGEEALRRLDELRPAALVLDLMMPGLDGFMLLDLLRERPAWRHLPVFVWTALSLGEADYARLSASAQAIATKGGGRVTDILESMLQWAAAQGAARAS
jgi:PAS domain S-box-containing protein